MIPSNQHIIILGMHRSGTSLVAGCLSKIGLFLGSELLGKNASNPLGHFEDQNLIELNDRILAAAGGTWDNPPPREKILNQAGAFHADITSLVSSMPSGTWGWKDPRLSLTIELFRPYIENPVFIVCQREFMRIAESLYNRNTIPVERGIELALLYRQRIDAFFECYPDLRRISVSHEDMCSDPGRIIRLLCSFLHIELKPGQYRKSVRFVVSKTKIRRLKRRIHRGDLVKAAFTQFFKNPRVFFIKLKNFLS
jgi:hypothetical protein